VGERWRSPGAARIVFVALCIALICGVGAADYLGGSHRVVIGLVLLGPFVMALSARPRATAMVGAFAVAVVLASPTWNHNWGAWDYWLRLVFVSFGCVVAVVTARGRHAEAENRRLADERASVADSLEAALVPSDMPNIDGWRIATLYRPAAGPARIGGDFYDSYRIERGWMLAIGDVVGHGPPAAALTGLVRYTLRTTATLTGSPSGALSKLNADLLARKSFDPCAITAVLLEDTQSPASVELICAGMPRPFLVRNGAVCETGKSGPLVGAFLDAAWEPDVVLVEEDDVLLFYTDGVLDLIGPEGRFGPERVREALQSAVGADDAIRRLRLALDDFARGAQPDDIVAVALERQGDSAI